MQSSSETFALSIILAVIASSCQQQQYVTNAFVVTTRLQHHAISSKTSLHARSSSARSATNATSAFDPYVKDTFLSSYSSSSSSRSSSDSSTTLLDPTEYYYATNSRVLEVISPDVIIAQQQQQEEEVKDSSNANDNSEEVVRARLLLLGAAALYGTNFALVKLLGDAMPVGISSALRFGMAALATLPWLVMPSNNNNKKDAATATWAGLEVGIWTSIGYVSQAFGLETTKASTSAFLCSLAVVVVPILDVLIGKTLTMRQVIGVLMAVVGVGFLELGDVASSDLVLTDPGNIASLMQPIFFGLGFWRMEKAMHAVPDQANRSTAAQLLAVFIASLLYCIITTPNLTNIPWHQWQTWLTDPILLGSLFWTGVITTALTVYMETVALKTLSAAETTLIFSTEPLWGAAFASLVIGEHFGLDAGIGAVLILAGCVFSNIVVSSQDKNE